MKIEHIAYPVEQPAEVAQWYAAHLNMKVVRADEQSPFMHFLADASGHVMVEFYNNPKVQVPDYKNMDPLLLHLAFETGDPDADQKRLVDAGATLLDDSVVPNGDRLIMLRDPWGFSVQLCKRKRKLI